MDLLEKASAPVTLRFSGANSVTLNFTFNTDGSLSGTIEYRSRTHQVTGFWSIGKSINQRRAIGWSILENPDGRSSFYTQSWSGQLSFVDPAQIITHSVGSGGRDGFNPTSMPEDMFLDQQVYTLVSDKS